MKAKGWFNLAGSLGLDLDSSCITNIQNRKWGGYRRWSSKSQPKGKELRTERERPLWDQDTGPSNEKKEGEEGQEVYFIWEKGVNET